MSTDQAQALRHRLRRSAGLLALEHYAAGTTPGDLTIKAHAEAIYQDAITHAEEAAASGAMNFMTAAGLIADTYDRLITDMQKAGKS